jgi:hypothetical protein
VENTCMMSSCQKIEHIKSLWNYHLDCLKKYRIHHKWWWSSVCLLYLSYLYVFRYIGVQYNFNINKCSCRWPVARQVSLVTNHCLPVWITRVQPWLFVDPSLVFWRWLENCCLRPKATVPTSSPAPRHNSFDCSLNRHGITVLLSYIHAHNHKSTEDDNVSIPYH